MEEAVGKFWHRWISQRADSDHGDAEVALDGVGHRLAILFRALGGDGGLRIEAAAPRRHGAFRPLLQRIAGSHERAPLAWRDGETLRLPPRIALYPGADLNRDLYLWLTALATVDEGIEGDWFRANQVRTALALWRYPGLMPLYGRLVEAELARRTPAERLPSAEAARERAIVTALLSPGALDRLPPGPRPPQPVYLWLYPAPDDGALRNEGEGDDGGEGPEAPDEAARESGQEHRYQGENVEMPEGKGGLITMRWENIFSWAEYVKVDRATEEEDDPGAAATAADMEVLSVARDHKAGSSRLRIDLDLPAREYDDIPLGGEILLPEWDWRKGRLLPDQCPIHPMLPRDAEPAPLPARLAPTARRLRGQFSALAQQRLWLGRQSQGSELDLDAWLDHYTSRHGGRGEGEEGLYRELRQLRRDIATLVLADLSLSTDAAVRHGQKVIDVIRDTLLLFSEALDACGDRYALHGFSSRRREEVRFFHLKPFEARYDDAVRGRILAIRPGYYTRMGAAIRHATSLLGRQKAARRLLLLLTDGKPNDLDKYEGRYGAEDTRKAILEAREQGLVPFCITIDRQAGDYLPHLFGANGFVVVRDPTRLPRKLLGLYAQLTRQV